MCMATHSRRQSTALKLSIAYVLGQICLLVTVFLLVLLC